MRLEQVVSKKMKNTLLCRVIQAALIGCTLNTASDIIRFSKERDNLETSTGYKVRKNYGSVGYSIWRSMITLGYLMQTGYISYVGCKGVNTYWRNKNE